MIISKGRISIVPNRPHSSSSVAKLERGKSPDLLQAPKVSDDINPIKQ